MEILVETTELLSDVTTEFLSDVIVDISNVPIFLLPYQPSDTKRDQIKGYGLHSSALDDQFLGGMLIPLMIFKLK